MSPRSSPLLLCLSYMTAPEEVALIKPSTPLEVPMAYTRFHSRPGLFTTNTSFILFVCVLVEHFASPSCGLTKQLNTATQAQPWASTLRLLLATISRLFQLILDKLFQHVKLLPWGFYCRTNLYSTFGLANSYN